MTGDPWRLVILDRDPADPKWILATVAEPADVWPAALDAAGRHTDLPDVARWVADRTGEPVELVSLHDALAWRIDGETEGARP